VSEYGSADWLERIYSASESDPWGLNWRPTQLYRYGRMLEELGRCKPAAGSVGRECLGVDMGCATGEFTALMSHTLRSMQPSRVMGFDLSATAVRRAAERFPDLQFQAGSFEQAAAQLAGSADVVSCLEVLYYVPAEQRAAALSNLKAMLRPGGLLLVSSMIGLPPYLDYAQLQALVGSQLTIVAGGELSLRPLSDIEKLSMKILRRTRGRDARDYLPGGKGFARVDRLSRLCRATFGKRSNSHGFVIARA